MSPLFVLPRRRRIATYTRTSAWASARHAGESISVQYTRTCPPRGSDGVRPRRAIGISPPSSAPCGRCARARTRARHLRPPPTVAPTTPGYPRHAMRSYAVRVSPAAGTSWLVRLPTRSNARSAGARESADLPWDHRRSVDREENPRPEVGRSSLPFTPRLLINGEMVRRSPAEMSAGAGGIGEKVTSAAVGGMSSFNLRPTPMRARTNRRRGVARLPPRVLRQRCYRVPSSWLSPCAAR